VLTRSKARGSFTWLSGDDSLNPGAFQASAISCFGWPNPRHCLRCCCGIAPKPSPLRQAIR
jgi:hypothetical protein